MILVRRIGSVLLVAAAIAVWFLMAPDPAPTPQGHTEQLQQILSDAEANNESAESAPQQQVVNGWVARDLLALIARQNDAVIDKAPPPRDNRPGALLALIVIGLALHLFTSLGPPQRESRSPTP